MKIIDIAHMPRPQKPAHSLDVPMKPNLFSIASKELSQDAFLTWFIQWADSSCEKHNPGLHAAGAQFLLQLISLQGTPPQQITSVKAYRQWANIDIWVVVNDSHLIIIEDKVGTDQHSDQLARYRKIGSDWCKTHNAQLICVYIKTQSDSSFSRDKVEEQGFAVLNRRGLLASMEKHSVNNDILADFLDQLRQVESNESQFTLKKIGEWESPDWKGFYQELEKRRKIENWGYVNNPSGGFWNAQLNWLTHESVFIYMQIEQGNLCFKVGEVYDNHRAVREHYHGLLVSKAPDDMGLKRPRRFGNGTYMTIAIIPRPVWLDGDEGTLNFAAVLDRLLRYESWLVETLATAIPVPMPHTISA